MCEWILNKLDLVLVWWLCGGGSGSVVGRMVVGFWRGEGVVVLVVVEVEVW